MTPFYFPPAHEIARSIVGQRLPELLDAIDADACVGLVRVRVEMRVCDICEGHPAGPETVHTWTFQLGDGAPLEDVHVREVRG
jgi:hypothetical protein